VEHGDDGALKLSTSPGGHGVWTAAKAKRARVACQQPLTILRYDCSRGLGGGVAQSQHLLLGMMEGCNPKQGQANKGTGAGDIMTKSARKVSIQADHYVLETALQMKLSHHLRTMKAQKEVTYRTKAQQRVRPLNPCSLSALPVAFTS